MFAGVVGLGAFLLFAVQLVLGKRLLPWFGGTSAVWTTCLLFYQVALLAGYLWAHVLVDRLSPRRQRDAHLALLAAALALLLGRALAWPSPITPPPEAAATSSPTVAILALLGSTIGLPFVALAATSPLLQAWFARLRPGRSPFRLFALSNGGSLLGLVSYPLLVEPRASLRVQGWLWSVGFAVYAAGVARCAVVAERAQEAPVSAGGPPAAMQPTSPWPRAGADRWRDLWLWAALAFFPSVMLAAVTSHLTQEVAAVPFLWMLPLSLYLLSFILSFAWPDAGRGGSRVALAAAAGLGVLGLHGALLMSVPARVGLWSVVLFAYGLAGHGELARERPASDRLTGYYLAIAAGGALGGLVNAVVAPLVFRGYWELHLGLLAGPLAVFAAVSASGRDARVAFGETGAAAWRQRRALAAVAVAALAVALLGEAAGHGRGVERTSRGFYGVLRVVRERPGAPDEHLKLLHGRIGHGIQLARAPRRNEPTSYFGPSSGAGLAIRRHPKRLAGAPLRVGVVGLGVGTLAAWSRRGDVFRFYELDPEVARLSEGDSPAFTYLRDAEGQVDVLLGDGRLVLERQRPQAYDVLVLDAFSSDAIPTHLLTREAFEAYLRHLAAGGVLVVQITNRYVDLKPVVRGAASALGLQAEHVPSVERGTLWSSDWMIVARDRALLDDEAVSAATLPRLGAAEDDLWTDDWSDLLRALRRF